VVRRGGRADARALQLIRQSAAAPQTNTNTDIKETRILTKQTGRKYKTISSFLFFTPQQQQQQPYNRSDNNKKPTERIYFFKKKGAKV
jgi:hypothetical protein